ncbi:MCP four helix bundle domain-containing protein [Cupriavidus respiraculi]|uniref:methyl-accepting chemotaxis protein n=1 Tax=Cupriavidus respiraculi TaxID=195930 RepID=UPI001C93DFF9|nr:methyl-accepting chemotaxis protein [Cupriavidus respiraculi]MBY4948687.1 MCP four helix bundle domain-containing protein [Cupriavidus respiraculi]
MHLKSLSIQTKLLLSFGALAFITLLISVVSLRALGDTSDGFKRYLSGINARAEMASQVRTAVDRRAISARNLVLVTAQADHDLEKAEVLKAHDDVQQRLKTLREMIESAARAGDDMEAARKLVMDMERIEGQYGPVANDILSLALANQREQAIDKMNRECRPLLAALVKATDAYADFTRTRQSGIIAGIEDSYTAQRNLLIVISIAAVALAAIGGLLITRSITRPIQRAVEIAQKVSQGDLTTRIVVTTRDETGKLLQALANMNAQLSDIVSRVRDGSGNVASASTQIATGNADLSQRTEEQAASLEETAASMEQLTATVKQSNDNARQANELAREAAGIAETGSAAVGRVVDTMQDISGSSAKIADITGMIEGIAFQTNILALNAAVEAARAGEQGRGFAVVASEVRSLAQRSSSASKEIKDLIAASLVQVQTGTTLAGEAGDTMAAVTRAVSRVTGMVGEIASASVEQARGIEQVNQAIAQIDQVTQQNATLVEQAAAASLSLQEQGQQLREAVAFFRLNGTAGRSSARLAADDGAMPLRIEATPA